jgi:hypothetical protein
MMRLNERWFRNKRKFHTKLTKEAAALQEARTCIGLATAMEEELEMKRH